MSANCRPMYCERKATCADTDCEGHPCHDEIVFLGPEPEDIGVEAALPAAFTAAPVKKPRDWTAIGIKCAVVATAILAMAAAWHR